MAFQGISVLRLIQKNLKTGSANRRAFCFEGDSEMTFDDILRKKPKTDVECALVIAVMRISVLPEFSQKTTSEIYDSLLEVAKQTCEYKETQKCI